MSNNNLPGESARDKLMDIVSQTGAHRSGPNPNQYVGRCPAHEDSNESFSVSINDDETRVLVHCFTGCSEDEIVAALGQTKQWLFCGDPDKPREPKGDAPKKEDRYTPPEVWAQWFKGWAANFQEGARQKLSTILDLPQSVFVHFPLLGAHKEHPLGPCLVHPEVDADGRITGAALRIPDLPPGEDKRSASGSKRGLAVPQGWKERPGPLHIVEGLSDTMAGTAAGLAVIGRPGVAAGLRLVADFVEKHVEPDRVIMVVGENDGRSKNGVWEWPGRDKALKFAQDLKRETGRDVRIVFPPNSEDKDMRAWMVRMELDGVPWGGLAERWFSLGKPESVTTKNGRGAARAPDGAKWVEETPPASGPDPLGEQVEGEPDPPLERAFADDHLERLRRAGLTNRTINGAGLYSESDPGAVAALLSWVGDDAARASTLGPCLVIPHTGWDGTRQRVEVRPSANPPGAGARLVGPPGGAVGAYIPPALVRNRFPERAEDGPKGQARPQLLVTTDPLDALCATQFGFPCLAVPSLTDWLKPRAGAGPRELLDEITGARVRDREFVFALRADLDRALVRRAAHGFQDALKNDGGRMKLLVLPPAPDGRARGLADVLTGPADGPDALREMIAAARPAPRPAGGELRNYDEIEVPAKKEEEPKIVQQPRSAGDILEDVYERTERAYPVAVGNVLYAVADGRLQAMPNATHLFAWLQRVFDVGGPRVRWANGLVGAPTKDEFYAGCVQRARRYDTTSPYPHCPPVPTVLYAPYQLAGGDGAALAKLIGFFNPATETDRVLLTAAFATPLWGGPPGKRPAFLFAPSADAAKAGRQTGKSTAATKVARLYGGSYALNSNEDWGDFTKKLINSASGDPKRVIIFDNAKTKKLSWGDFEAFVTAPAVNGHQLYAGSREVPNYYTAVITINGAALSTDLSLRCVPVHFETPTYSPTWESEVDAFIDGHRAEIFGDIAAVLGLDAEPVARHGRFPEWESQVLSRVAGGATAAVVDAIREWQEDTDGDSEGADHIREAVRNVVAQTGDPLAEHLKHTPLDRAVLWFTARAVHQLMMQAIGERLNMNAASSALRTAGVTEFEQVRRSDLGGRGWVWHGADAAPGARITHRIDYAVNEFETWSATPVDPPKCRT